mmetsp:Transcript_38408/g.62249  ORF Transcript_38408/g.62249 Transcript_38408/m.62249 type:complete len:183 (-) Transcript_38408:226-774(-)
MFSASSALTSDLYGRLPSLTSLSVMHLDNSLSWSVNDVLRQLASPNILQSLSIHNHEFTEALLEIALPMLDFFMITSPAKLPRTISMDCPKLRTIILYGGSEDPTDKLERLSLARCPSLETIELDGDCVDSITVEWIVQLVQGCSDEARKRLLHDGIWHVVDNLDEEEQYVFWRAVRALAVV